MQSKQPKAQRERSPVNVRGGSLNYQLQIRRALESYPAWVLNAANLSTVEVSRSPEVRSQVAQYEHDSRKLYVSEGVGVELLNRSIGHELAHGLDDDYGSPHFFSSSDTWRSIHRDQGHFDIQKYADEPLEYFADMFQKYLIFGYEKMRLTHPSEAEFFLGYVEPVTKQQHGNY